MTILVTGGAGFIGSSLTEVLLDRGDQVVAMDNFNDYYSPERKKANIAPFLSRQGFSLCKSDFRDPKAVQDAFKRFSVSRVVHLGAMGSVRYSVQNPEIYISTNIVGTANLLEAAQQNGVENFVNASTSSVYGQTDKIPFVETDPTDRPLAPYPASKKAGEVLGHAYHNMHGMNFTALRFFNVYGPKGRPDMMPYIVLENIIKKKTITLFDNGDMRRDWTYIDDIVAGIVAALDKPMGYEILNLGRGEPVLMTDFMDMMEKMTGKKAIVKDVPAPACEPKVTFANVDKARKLLGYDPQTSLEEGLQRFADWYQQEVAGG